MSEQNEGISFQEYQEETRTTAIYPMAGTGDIMALAYLGLGLGEAGEVQGKLKKILRDDQGVVFDEKRSAIIDELGDVLWYVARMADELDVSFEDVARRNLTKLADRKARDVVTGSGDSR